MVEAILAIIALFAVAVLLFYLAVRSFRRGRGVLRWLGTVLASLLGLLIGAVGAVALAGFLTLHAPRVPPPPKFAASSDPQVIARGEHLADILCSDCHAANKQLPLSGAPNLLADSPLPMGFSAPYNLTPGGPLKDWTDGEIFRAIRHNVDKNGVKLVVMNSTGIGTLSDEDIQALVAYLRSQPASNNDFGPEKFSLVGYMVLGGGMIPQFSRPNTISAPAEAPDAKYGEYITSYLSCRDCHGPNLSGGKNDLLPKGPNLVQAVSGWTAEQFITTIRTGKTPEGRQLAPTLMPYQTYSKANDVELRAIYEYLRSLGGETAEK